MRHGEVRSARRVEQDRPAAVRTRLTSEAQVPWMRAEMDGKQQPQTDKGLDVQGTVARVHE
ncbi:hypothetical protein ACFU5O_36045 [Streptomyces sp. NPDC057445]|uniref:hypothetical protein n=1 Tax=Streptomyces sp. NPDC057445 TaxID=3346136 RepID=UPI0036AA3AAF